MKLRLFHLLLAGLVGRALAAALPLAAQPVPEVVWQTNAHAKQINSLGFSADSSLLASGGNDGTAKLWRLSDAMLLRSFISPNESVTAVAVSPDGNYLATGTDADARVRLWRIDDGLVLWRRGRRDEVCFSVAFSPDGTVLASATSEGRINLWRVPHGSEIATIEAQGWVYAVGFAPDGSLLGSGSSDRTAKVWRVADTSLMQILTGHSDSVNSIAFHPDGASLATGSLDGTTRVWDVSAGAVLRILQSGQASTVAFSADGVVLGVVNSFTKFFTTLGGPIQFWRLCDGRLLLAYPDINARSLAISPDGKYFAYGTAGDIFLARMPLWISEVSRTGNQVTLQWQGGSGRYQLQGRTNLAVSQWENLGPATTNRTVTLTCSNVMFFRLQSLSNP